MREASGDIWTYEPADAIVIPTNGAYSERYTDAGGKIWAVMGKGVALDCKRKFPGIDSYLGLLIKQRGNVPHILCNMMRPGTNANGPYIVSFPTKHENWRVPSDPVLIAQSAASLVQITTENGWQHVVMPRVGSGVGTGQLPWPKVKSVIEPILDDRFIVLDGVTNEE